MEILLNHGVDIEVQSEHTKDTPLSLACSGGRYEVVEILLSRGTNKEQVGGGHHTFAAEIGTWLDSNRLDLQGQQGEIAT